MKPKLELAKRIRQLELQSYALLSTLEQINAKLEDIKRHII